MKKVIEVSIGGLNFVIEDDAYFRLKGYLTRFEATMTDKQEAKEVMEDVEARVAEIFQKEMKYDNQVVDMAMVDVVILHLGELESEDTDANEQSKFDNSFSSKGNKRFFRDPDDKKIAGVCSGLAAYFDVDVSIIRIIFLVVLLAYGTTFFLYIVLWIVTKEAITIPQKLEMRGIPVTAENIRKYMSQYK